ncbi:MAG: TonB-dependent receptor [Bryobacteraceae bacterium]|nr:TonB-dependent receptor [Bryobacteraceae bacterium]
MIFVALLLLLLVVTPVSEAQTLRGSIAGAVANESGRPVPGAAVTLTHRETDRPRTATTNGEGGFVFAQLPPGSYDLEVVAEGHRRHAQRLTLLTNQEIDVEVRLLPGQITERVVVTAARSVLRTDSAALGSVIETNLIRGLPLDGRNFLELTLLLPGVAPSAQGSAASVRGATALNVNGAREDSNNYLLDGVYNSDPMLNNSAVNPSVDATREFEVLTGDYDATFGRNAGAQVSVVLQSGGNAWHGAGYEFLRNAALDARNYFAPAREPDPKYQRHQFGGSLGGPLIRNRTFIFGNYEGLRLREGVTRTTNVPTALERAGDFSQSAQPPYDPLSGQPFPGNRIPSFFIHPTGAAIAALYPLPNRDVPQQNYVSSPSIRDRADQFDLRLDQALGSAGDLTFRYSFADQTRYLPFSGPGFPAVPGYGTTVPRRPQNIMVSETHAFSPVWINEARVAFTRVATASFHENYGVSVNTRLGLPETSSNSRDFGLSHITLPGFSSLGDETNNPQQSVTNTFQALDHVTHARGAHTIRFGFDYRRTQQNAFRDVQSRGFLNFLGITGNPLSDLLLGFPTVTGVARLDNPQYLRTWSGNFFVADAWRIRPDLTLSAGVRYEYNAPPVDKFDRSNVYEPAMGALVQVGTNGIPRSGYYADRNNWAPRVGLAWRPGGLSGTVLRAGYGIYYDQSSLAPGEGLYFNPPYFDFRLFFPLEGLFLTLSDPFPEDFPFQAPPSALSYQRDLRSPYLQHWSFTAQQRLGHSRVLEVGYVGSKGTKQLSARDINQPRPSPVSPNLRPVPYFADINQLESRSNSNYNSLQARLQQHVTRGLSLLASYTWSKSIDDASSFFASAADANFPQNSYNLRAERGRSNFDLRQRLTFSYSWELPFGRGKRFLTADSPASRVFGGWETFGIWTFQTGRPVTVALLSELDNSNTGRSILGFGANDRPNVVRDPALANPTTERWFDPGAFQMPPFGSFGNAGRNIVDGPGLQTVNVSLLRDFSVSEGLRFQFRAEAFNLLNRANFDLPDVFLGSPTFGRILSAQSPRRIQFGVKALF